MEIFDRLLAIAYFMGVVAALLGTIGWWLEYKKAEGKKPFFIFGILASIFLLITFGAIIVSAGLQPIAPVYILRVTIRISVIGYAAFKLLFEIVRVSKLVSVDPNAASKQE